MALGRLAVAIGTLCPRYISLDRTKSQSARRRLRSLPRERRCRDRPSRRGRGFPSQEGLTAERSEKEARRVTGGLLFLIISLPVTFRSGPGLRPRLLPFDRTP